MANMLCSKIEEDRADFACEIKKAASLVQAKKEENASEAPNMDRAGHHPLNATETRKHDYQEDYRDFSPLPLTNNVGRTKSIDAYNKANPTRPLEGTDYDAFDGVRIRSASLHRSHRCPSCHAVGTEFVRRAASLESGNSFDTVLCERCGAVDMTEQWKLAKAKEYVRESAEMLRACRVAAMIDDRNLRAKFLNAVAGQVAGISKAHVETVLTDTVRSLGIDIGDGSTTVGTCGGYDRIKSVASKFGFVTTADILAACGEDGSDVAAVKLAYSGFRIVPCSASTVKLDDLERRLASRLKGKWSKVRLSALSGDDVSDAAIANDRVFKVWAAMQENPIGGQIDFCDVCTGSLDGSGVCLECGTSKIGDCSQCGS
jgi:hypothetical protein